MPIMSSPGYPHRFCQVSIEIHFPIEVFGGMNERLYREMIQNFLLEGHYLPVWFENNNNGLAKGFFIDVLSEECAEKYFKPSDDNQCR